MRRAQPSRSLPRAEDRRGRRTLAVLAAVLRQMGRRRGRRDGRRLGLGVEHERELSAAPGGGSGWTGTPVPHPEICRFARRVVKETRRSRSHARQRTATLRDPQRGRDGRPRSRLARIVSELGVRVHARRGGQAGGGPEGQGEHGVPRPGVRAPSSRPRPPSTTSPHRRQLRCSRPHLRPALPRESSVGRNAKMADFENFVRSSRSSSAARFARQHMRGPPKNFHRARLAPSRQCVLRVQTLSDKPAT